MENVWLFIILILGTFFFMEFVAWFTHKFVMHGVLWMWHKDHHVKENPSQILEKNDYFFVIFALPGIVCIALGSLFEVPYVLPIGIGVTLYGLCYFLVHDVFIHQRIKWMRTSNHIYFRAIRRAHKMHHKHITKEDGECFGMLIVPWKYLIAEIKKP